jgi:hypothetical protein
LAVNREASAAVALVVPPLLHPAPSHTDGVHRDTHQLLQPLGTNMQLRRFDSGVLVVQVRSLLTHTKRAGGAGALLANAH